MSETQTAPERPTLEAVVDALARAGGCYLRVTTRAGETVCESSVPPSAARSLTSTAFDLPTGGSYIVEGELEPERLSAVARTLAQVISLESDLVTAKSDLGRTREELAILFDFSQSVCRVTSVEDVVERFLADVVNVLDAREGTFLAVDDVRKELRILCHHGSTPKTVAEFRLAIGEGIAGRVALDGQARIVNDTAKCEYYVEGINPIGSVVCVPVRVGGRVVGVVSINDRTGGEPFTLAHLQLLTSLARLGEIGLENARLYQEVRSLLFDAVDALTRVMEARSQNTVGHCRRVARVAYSLGRQLRLGTQALERVYLAGLLHDVGRAALPPGIGSYDGPLPEYEEDVVRSLPEIGAGILKSTRRLSVELPGLLDHTERFDGKGKPKGLSGEDISLQGRIIAVADAYDTMTSSSVRRSRPSDALSLVRVDAGRRFDPRVVEAFEHVYKVLRLESSVPPEDEDKPWDSSGGIYSGWSGTGWDDEGPL